MSTARQIAANKKNAQKSTGPKTPEGRAAVRLNGLKHGLTAEELVLWTEKETDFHALLDSLEAEHAPTTPTEELLVRQMAMAAWRLRRFYHMEAGFLALRLTDHSEELDEDYQNLSDSARLGMVAYRDSKTMANLSRYEGRLERSFHKALRELQRLRAERPVNLQNQTQSLTPETQIHEVKPLPAAKILEIQPTAAEPSRPSREIDRP